MKELINKLNWTLEAKPDLYSRHPNTYIIYGKFLGKYKKHDADIICEFLRSGAIQKIIYQTNENKFLGGDF